MSSNKLENVIGAILEKEDRFEPGAYFLIREALDFTVEKLSKENQGENRHVTGGELLLGFRDYLLEEYGPMSATLLADWGIESCRNVGEIVFLFIEHEIFGKQDSDSLDDFGEIFSFQEEFTDRFVPQVK